MPMKTRRLDKILTIATAGAALLAATSVQARSDAEMEAEAAREFAKIKASAPLTTNRETINYVACVATAVVKVLEPPHSNYNWEMAIVETDQVNAFVMPGGKIVVYEGILRAARNQHQPKSKLLQGRPAQIGVAVAAVLLGGGHYGATYTAQEALSQGAMYGLVLPYKRGQETEADVIGLEYMADAGFDPRESVPLWQNMGEIAGEARSEFSSTHPSGDKRIDSLVSEWTKVLPLYNQAHEEDRIPNCQVPPHLQKPIDHSEPEASPTEAKTKGKGKG
jgi:predicted Zn-dependent protease